MFKKFKIIDLTGAGDLLCWILDSYINNLSLKESLQKGTEMSSKIIQKIGASFLEFFSVIASLPFWFNNTFVIFF